MGDFNRQPTPAELTAAASSGLLPHAVLQDQQAGTAGQTEVRKLFSLHGSFPSTMVIFSHGLYPLAPEHPKRKVIIRFVHM